jgi:hypothetical protein
MAPLPSPPLLPPNNVSLSPSPRLTRVPSFINLGFQQSENDLTYPGVVLFACSHDTRQHQRHVTLGFNHSLALDERVAFVRGNAEVVMHHIHHQEMVVLRHRLTSAGSKDAY